MQMNKQSKQLLSSKYIYPGMFDLPKGLFMLLVFLGHAVIMNYDVWNFPLSPLIRRKVIGVLYNVLFGGSIPMLFLCCGYTWRKRSMRKAIKTQFSTIFMPYAVTGIFILILVLLSWLLIGGNLLTDLQHTFLPVLLGFCPSGHFLGLELGASGPLWCVVTFFLAGIILNAILQEKETWIQVCLVLILACIGLLIQVSLPFCIRQSLICTGYMYCGWLMKKSNFLTRQIPVYCIAAIAVFGFGVIGLDYFDMSSISFRNGLVDILGGLAAGTIVLITVLNANRWESRILSAIRWMGRECFLLCCIHTVFALLPTTLFYRLYVSLFLAIPSKPLGIIVLFLFFLLTAVIGAITCKKISLYIRRRKCQRSTQ